MGIKNTLPLLVVLGMISGCDWFIRTDNPNFLHYKPSQISLCNGFSVRYISGPVMGFGLGKPRTSEQNFLELDKPAVKFNKAVLTTEAELRDLFVRYEVSFQKDLFKDGPMELEFKCLPDKPVVRVKLEGDLLKKTIQITENSGVAEGFQIAVVSAPGN
jgi:hypothetical protein